jgi:hypothetical protein
MILIRPAAFRWPVRLRRLHAASLPGSLLPSPSQIGSPFSRTARSIPLRPNSPSEVRRAAGPAPAGAGSTAPGSGSGGMFGATARAPGRTEPSPSLRWKSLGEFPRPGSSMEYLGEVPSSAFARHKPGTRRPRVQPRLRRERSWRALARKRSLRRRPWPLGCFTARNVDWTRGCEGNGHSERPPSVRGV